MKTQREKQLAEALRDALSMFKATQRPADYAPDHWSHRAVRLLSEPTSDDPEEVRLPTPYSTSRDYERLFHEMQIQPIICLYHEYGEMRVAQTLHSVEGPTQLPCWKVVDPTLCLYATNKEQFIDKCRRHQIEVLFPTGAPSIPHPPPPRMLRRMNDSMLDLTINNEGEVHLPATIAGSRLTLEEIGALVCLQCPIDEKRWYDPKFGQILTKLKNDGVVSIGVDQDTLKLEINLKAIGL